MKIQELMRLLDKFPDNLSVFLATAKHETVTLCDVRDENSRGERIIILSCRGVWPAPRDEQC